MNLYVIGAGGVGSWLTPAMCLLAGKNKVTVIDGDTIEVRNLNRQLFKKEHVGENKAEIMAEIYGCHFIPQFYSLRSVQVKHSDVLMVAADNHPARVDALQECDVNGCRAIVMANEKHSSEAYIYDPDWQGSPADPRVMNPEMMSDPTGDPRAAAIGCTGEAQQRTPQLVGANLSAASLGIHLYTLWIMEAPKMDPEVLPCLPFLLRANLSRLEQLIVGDYYKGHNNE